MYQRLYELAEFLCTDRFQPWELLNHGMPPHYDRGLAICFDASGNYAGVRTLFSHQGVDGRGVVYRPGPGSNSAPPIPCTPLSAKMGSKIRFLFRTASEMAEQPGLDPEWRVWLAAIDWQDKELQKRVVRDLDEGAKEAQVGTKLDGGRTRSGYCFPARFDGGVIQPLYELEAAKDLMVAKSKAVLAKGGKSEGICFTCGKRRTIYGNFSELKCYMLDKPGLITGGFNQAKAYRNCPICWDCALKLSYAIRHVQDHLSARMAGQDYLVMPCSTGDPAIREIILEELQRRPQRFTISSDCDLLVQFDQELLAFMQEERLREQLSLSVIFYREKQKEWKILAEVQEVPPSRLKRVREVKTMLERDPALRHAGKDRQPVSVTAQTVALFSNEGGASQSARLFCQWMEAVLRGASLDRRQVCRYVVKTLLATARREPQYLHRQVAQGWAFYLFLARLNLFPEGGNPMGDNATVGIYRDYIEKHRSFFTNAAMTAAFLTGCYVQVVCAKQKGERGHDASKQAPFAKKFQGRLLSRKHLERLFREGHDKLAVYGGLGIVIGNGLQADLAQAWVDCAQDWEISDEEATFAFLIGYCLGWHIADRSGTPSPAAKEEDHE